MSLPPEASRDDVKVRIRESIKNPNVGKVEQVVLKEGPRAFRLATLYEIIDPESGISGGPGPTDPAPDARRWRRCLDRQRLMRLTTTGGRTWIRTTDVLLVRATR